MLVLAPLRHQPIGGPNQHEAMVALGLFVGVFTGAGLRFFIKNDGVPGRPLQRAFSNLKEVVQLTAPPADIAQWVDVKHILRETGDRLIAVARVPTLFHPCQ